MLGNLQTPPEPFEDVIKTHFKLKATEINEQMDHWLKLDDKAKPTSNDMVGGSGRAETAINLKADIASLKNLIKGL
jgi:hypothetical protein